MSLSKSTSLLSLGLISLAALVSTTAGCSDDAEGDPTGSAIGNAKSALTVSGQVDAKAYPLDNPAVVAQCADGKIVVAPVAANGTFRLALHGDAGFRLLLANAVGASSYYAISHIQWHHDAGFSEWAKLGGESAAAINVGTIAPMTKDDAAKCASCNGAASAMASGAAAARAGIWGQASGGAGGYVAGEYSSAAQFDAQYNASLGFGSEASAGGGGGGLLGSVFGEVFGGASANIDVSASFSGSASAKAKASVQGQWGWVGGGAWTGTWGGSASGGAIAASGTASADWHVCDELQLTRRLNFSATGVADGVQAAATADGTAEADLNLGTGCGTSGFQQPPTPQSTPVATGGACSVNAECGASAFCASSRCVASDAAAVR